MSSSRSSFFSRKLAAAGCAVALATHGGRLLERRRFQRRHRRREQRQQQLHRHGHRRRGVQSADYRPDDPADPVGVRERQPGNHRQIRHLHRGRSAGRDRKGREHAQQLVQRHHDRAVRDAAVRQGRLARRPEHAVHQRRLVLRRLRPAARGRQVAVLQGRPVRGAVLRRVVDALLQQVDAVRGRDHHADAPDLGAGRGRRGQAQPAGQGGGNLPARPGRLGRQHGLARHGDQHLRRRVVQRPAGRRSSPRPPTRRP